MKTAKSEILQKIVIGKVTTSFLNEVKQSNTALPSVLDIFRHFAATVH